MKRFSQLFVAIVAILVVAVMLNSVAFANSDKNMLSELSYEDLYEYMLFKGLVIPKECDIHENNLKMIKYFVEKFESDPDAEYSGGMPCYGEVFYQVKRIVLSYYGGSDNSTKETNVSNRYTLQYSTFFNDGLSSQNCYGYVLGSYSFNYPGYYAYGSNFTGAQLASFSASDLADRVVADLHSSAYNYPYVKKSTIRPSYVAGRTTICIRKGSHDVYGYYDFHLMKLTPTNVWRHKPGSSDILTFNSQPSNAVYWTNEYATNSYTFYQGDTTYDSTIYYITYSDTAF